MPRCLGLNGDLAESIKRRASDQLGKPVTYGSSLDFSRAFFFFFFSSQHWASWLLSKIIRFMKCVHSHQTVSFIVPNVRRRFPVVLVFFFNLFLFFFICLFLAVLFCCQMTSACPEEVKKSHFRNLDELNQPVDLPPARKPVSLATVRDESFFFLLFWGVCESSFTQKTLSVTEECRAHQKYDIMCSQLVCSFGWLLYCLLLSNCASLSLSLSLSLSSLSSPHQKFVNRIEFFFTKIGFRDQVSDKASRRNVRHKKPLSVMENL